MLTYSSGAVWRQKEAVLPRGGNRKGARRERPQHRSGRPVQSPGNTAPGYAKARPHRTLDAAWRAVVGHGEAVAREASGPLPKQPLIDKKTLDDLNRESPPPPPPASEQQLQSPEQSKPQPSQAVPPNPQSQSQVEAPRPSAVPAKPNFALGSPNPADQLKNDMQQAMRNRGQSSYGNAPSGGLSMHPGAGTGAPDILSDTQGVDFSSWLARWHYVTQQTWDPLIPDEVNPPILKSGVVAIRFKVLPNGQVVDMTLDGRSGDTALDRAAWVLSPAPATPPCPGNSTAPTSNSAPTSSIICSRGSFASTLATAELPAQLLPLRPSSTPLQAMPSALQAHAVCVADRGKSRPAPAAPHTPVYAASTAPAQTRSCWRSSMAKSVRSRRSSQR